MAVDSQRIALEDELGDVLEKAMNCAGLTPEALAERSGVAVSRILDAIDYRPELGAAECSRLAAALGLNEVGLCALASGKYPLLRYAHRGGARGRPSLGRGEVPGRRGPHPGGGLRCARPPYGRGGDGRPGGLGGDGVQDPGPLRDAQLLPCALDAGCVRALGQKPDI